MRLFYLVSILLSALSLGADKKSKITDLNNQVDDRLRQIKQQNRDAEVEEGQRLIEARKKELSQSQFKQITPPVQGRGNCADNPGACRFEGPPNDPKSIPVFPTPQR